MQRHTKTTSQDVGSWATDKDWEERSVPVDVGVLGDAFNQLDEYMYVKTGTGTLIYIQVNYKANT